MNNLKLFNKDDWSIRVIDKDGEPWFVAADVCRALEVEDTWKAVDRLDEDEATSRTARARSWGP